MSERGESPDPVRMLSVATWRRLRASRGRVQRGLESPNLRPPNMRVQRARSSDSPRSPLTRHPLGGGRNASASWLRLRNLGLFQSPATADVLRIAVVGLASIAVQTAQHRLAHFLRFPARRHRNSLPAPPGVPGVAEGAIGLGRAVLWRWRPDGSCLANQKQSQRRKRPNGNAQDWSHAFLRSPMNRGGVSVGQSNTAPPVTLSPPPNMRVRRTRSSASPPSSPLTRWPSGDSRKAS